MFLVVGVKIIYLKRIQFGNFTLDPDLATGDCRPLNQEELEIIKEYLERKSVKTKSFETKLFVGSLLRS